MRLRTLREVAAADAPLFDLAALRQRLNTLDDVALDDFCLDHFPAVYEKFARGLRPDEALALLQEWGREQAGVELVAWQSIDLPRQWDNPDCEWDADPDEQLADLFGQVGQALRECEGCLGTWHRGEGP